MPPSAYVYGAERTLGGKIRNHPDQNGNDENLLISFLTIVLMGHTAIAVLWQLPLEARAI